MTTDARSAGDAIPKNGHVIEVRVAELRQLFNAIDPSPFNERDLDPRAEEFIVDWSRDFPRRAPLALLVHLQRRGGHADEADLLRDAVHEFFGQRAAGSRRRLRELFHRGRISLGIGLACVALSIAIGDAVATHLSEGRWGDIVRESLLIGGWVAMWRPLEVFLYDWWPIRADVRLFDRLGAMPVRIVYETDAPPAAWRPESPVTPAAGPHSNPYVSTPSAGKTRSP